MTMQKCDVTLFDVEFYNFINIFICFIKLKASISDEIDFFHQIFN